MKHTAHLINHVNLLCVSLFLRLFFRSYGEGIEELPDVLVDRVSLLPELLEGSRAKSTCDSFRRGFRRWAAWALSNGLTSRDILPAKAFHVAIYLSSLIQIANSPSSVYNAFYSVKWFHDLFDFNSVSDSKLISSILEAAKRKLSKPV